MSFINIFLDLTNTINLNHQEVVSTSEADTDKLNKKTDVKVFRYCLYLEMRKKLFTRKVMQRVLGN